MGANSTDRLRAVPWHALAGLSNAVLPCVQRVLGGAAAEREIDRLLRANRAFTPAQRAAVVEAIFGVALWRRRLAAEAGSPEPRSLLFSLLRNLAGLPDAPAGELSGLAPPFPPLGSPPRRLADRWSFPDWIETAFVRELGAEAEQLAEAMCSPGPICLRANALRVTRDELARALAAEGVQTRPARYARDGLVVPGRANLFGLRAWRKGLFELQDEGSQLVAQLLRAQPGDTVLDLCAGSGGKTLALAAAMRNRGRLLATDPDRERLDRLRSRAQRAGATCIEIGAPAMADAVLVDAPCSELGALRRGPDLRFRLSEAEARRLPSLQRQILETALRHVRPGGRLVYATCTIRREENEDVALAFEQAHPELARVSPELPSELLQDGFLRTFPHRHEMDGFFGAVWRKL